MKTQPLFLVLLCALLVPSPTRSQPVTTAPASRFPMTLNPTFTETRFYLNFDLPENVEGPSGFEVSAAMGTVRQALPPGIGWDLGGPVGASRSRFQMRLVLNGQPLLRYGDAAIQSIVDRLNELLVSQPRLAPDALNARLKDLGEQRQKLEEQRDLATALAGAQGNAHTLLNEKLAQLRSARQKLDMDLAAKEARRKALSEAIQVQKSRVDVEVAGDAITKELQNLVTMREAALNIAKNLAATSMDRADAEIKINSASAAVSEAKIRLAERQAQLGKAGKGDLIDRLSDELAMTSVDAADLQIQAERVASELRKYDIRAMNSDGLAQLTQQDASMRQNGEIPVFDEIAKRQEAIALEGFKSRVMLVSSLSIQELPPTPGVSGGGGGRGAGGRGGRGGGAATLPQQ